MENNLKLINLKEMFEDFSNYDPLYDRFFNDKADDSSADFYDALKEIAQIEKVNRNNFRDYNYYNLIKLIEFIYGESDQARLMAEIISIVHEKILRDYLNIPYLDKLVSETYFEYEWEMHSRLDSEKLKIDFYRDHYFHQIRNLYEIYKFFETKIPETSVSFVDKIIDAFWDGDSNTSRYCKEIYYDAYKYYLGNTEYKRIFEMLAKKTDSTLKGTEKKDKETENIEDYFKRFAKTYIIKGALYVASLVHDIGYPIGKQIEKNRRFARFLSNTAFNKGVFEFENIRNIIESSLLFSIVGTEEVKRNLEKKLDHGVMSAIVLLVHYYEHGAIHKLSPLKRAIIEFAAIIIYDHTADYKLVESKFDEEWDKKQYREFSPCFKKNPISLIFRFADDIQEWDRTYFETAHYSDIRICAKCKKPMLKQKLNSHFIENAKKNYLLYQEDANGQFCLNQGNIIKENFIYSEFTKYRHVCGCSKNSQNQWQGGYEINYGMYKHQLVFHNKKINYVITCNRIYYIFDGKTFQVLIDYNPFKLLELLRLSNDGNPANFHAHRFIEIEKLKEIIKLSRLDINENNYNFEVLAYIQCHPYLLKRKIIFDFLASIYYIKKNEIKIKPKEKDSIKFYHDFYELYKYDLCVILSDINDDILNEIMVCLKKCNDLLQYFPYQLFDEKEFNGEEEKCIIKYLADLILLLLGDKKKTNNQNKVVKWINYYLFEDGLIDGTDKSINDIKIKSLCEEKLSASKIKSKFSYLQNVIDSDCYTGKNVKYNIKKNFNNTDLFYNDFYILGIMNDFTEMVKNMGGV